MKQNKSISGKSLSETLTTDDILGKDVIDTRGTNVGVVDKVLISPKTLDLIGINVDRGLVRKPLSIGKNYIERVAKEAVFLNIRVAYEIKGADVFDKSGKKIGTVSDVILAGTKNQIKSLTVSRGLFSKKLLIPASSIKEIGYNVVLTISSEEASGILPK